MFEMQYMYTVHES